MARKYDSFVLPFPIKGLDEASAYRDQPRLTCVDAQNVRAFGQTEDRARGGQRPGIRKFCPSQINGSSQIQDLVHVTAVSTTAPSATGVGYRTTKMVAVAGGVIKTFSSSAVATPTDNAAATPPHLSATAPVIFSAAYYGNVYFVDGSTTNWVYYKTSTDSIEDWTASAGSLPVSGSNTPRLIESWRGRLVLSGLAPDPHNWFMSKVADATDWDYSPTTQTEGQAVSGSQDGAGKVGDVITSLCAYSDDLLFLFCDHSLWQMSGDPMAGGRLDKIADVGAPFGRPWCRGPANDVYFWAMQGGMYRVVPGSGAVPIASGISDRFESIDLDKYLIRMAYDERQTGIFVWTIPLISTYTPEYYFYDMRTESWWPDYYANGNHYARAAHVFDGDSPNDRAILLGCKDGYVRTVDRGTTSDDGTAIDSYVTIGPVRSRGKTQPFVLDELQATMGSLAANTTLEIHAGESEEDALTGEEYQVAGLLTANGEEIITAGMAPLPKYTLTVASGRGKAFHPRVRAHAMYLKLGNSTIAQSWEMESLRLRLARITSSRARQEG